jgi:myo-inositol-1(or 4)-monophosphatase
MLHDLIDLARHGGRIGREYFLAWEGGAAGASVETKRPRDYVSHVDRSIEQALVDRIHTHHPSHQVLGEEGAGAEGLSATKPLWIIDPLDGTTNFLHGIPGWAVSIALCDPRPEGFVVRYGVVYDPMRDELFSAEAGSGAWLNGRGSSSSGCRDLSRALVASALPFRTPVALDEAGAVFMTVQKACDDHRRGGAAALDLSYVACGRLDAYYELGIHCWDTAAGELLVRCAGGAATDYRNDPGVILSRRTIVAAASPDLHRQLLAHVAPLQHWIDDPAFTPQVPPVLK